jgi:hypothetical protein
MRKATTLALFLFLCLATIPAFAQTETPNPIQPTMTPEGTAESTAEATMQAGSSTAIMNPMNLTGSDNVTFVRFVNTVIDVPSIDLYVQELGDQAVVTDLTFGKVTDSMLLPAGEYNVVARAAGSGVGGETLTTMKWNFQPETSWVVSLVGQTSNASLQLEPLNLLRNDIADDVSRLRVVNLVAGTPELKISSSAGDDFGQALGWTDVFDADMKPGTYNLTVTSKDGKSLLTDAAVDMGGGALSTVILVGSADGSKPLQLVTFNSPAYVSRVRFVNNSSAPIQIFMRPGDTELVPSLAVGETSDWVTVPSGSVTFVAYAPGTGPSGQELGSWIGMVQPMRDVIISFAANNIAEASEPVFSPVLSETKAAG